MKKATKVRGRPRAKRGPPPRRYWFQPCKHLRTIRYGVSQLEYAVGKQNVQEIKALSVALRQLLKPFGTVQSVELL